MGEPDLATPSFINLQPMAFVHLGVKLGSINIEQIEKYKEANYNELCKLSYIRSTANKIKDLIKDADKAFSYKLTHMNKKLSSKLNIKEIKETYDILWGIESQSKKIRSPFKVPFKTKSENLNNEGLKKLAIKMKKYEECAAKRQKACEKLDSALSQLISMIKGAMTSLETVNTSYQESIREVEPLPTQEMFNLAINGLYKFINEGTYPKSTINSYQGLNDYITNLLGE